MNNIPNASPSASRARLTLEDDAETAQQQGSALQSPHDVAKARPPDSVRQAVRTRSTSPQPRAQPGPSPRALGKRPSDAPAEDQPVALRPRIDPAAAAMIEDLHARLAEVDIALGRNDVDFELPGFMTRHDIYVYMVLRSQARPEASGAGLLAEMQTLVPPRNHEAALLDDEDRFRQTVSNLYGDAPMLSAVKLRAFADGRAQLIELFAQPGPRSHLSSRLEASKRLLVFVQTAGEPVHAVGRVTPDQLLDLTLTRAAADDMRFARESMEKTEIASTTRRKLLSCLREFIRFIHDRPDFESVTLVKLAQALRPRDDDWKMRDIVVHAKLNTSVKAFLALGRYEHLPNAIGFVVVNAVEAGAESPAQEGASDGRPEASPSGAVR